MSGVRHQPGLPERPVWAQVDAAKWCWRIMADIDPASIDQFGKPVRRDAHRGRSGTCGRVDHIEIARSEEHTSELQSLMRISYAVFCLKKKQNKLYEHKSQRQTNTHKR